MKIVLSEGGKSNECDLSCSAGMSSCWAVPLLSPLTPRYHTLCNMHSPLHAQQWSGLSPTYLLFPPFGSFEIFQLPQPVPQFSLLLSPCLAPSLLLLLPSGLPQPLQHAGPVGDQGVLVAAGPRLAARLHPQVARGRLLGVLDGLQRRRSVDEFMCKLTRAV